MKKEHNVNKLSGHSESPKTHTHIQRSESHYVSILSKQPENQYFPHKCC